MQERKRPAKNIPAMDLEKSSIEILVANGRSLEPFIKTFAYSGENVSRLDLGMLVGVFKVDEYSEDSAYIVNFLASVAKKEYFSNPRRGAIESFEAALHKINLALAELVKHGNVAWLGRLHGTIGVFEKSNFHFSATGNGSILLLRDDNLNDIASGLASEESASHPIKTFIEISSGRLLPSDRIIFSSPELLQLFSLDDLLKNALRMDEGRFDQFLKTALVNELDIAGTIVMHIKEKDLSLAKKASEKKSAATEEVPKPISNVFSQAAFSSNAQRQASIQEAIENPPEKKAERNEYVDSKTGHIYIQGNEPGTPTTHPFLESAGIFFQEVAVSFRSFLISRSKWIRKARKQSSIAFHVLTEEAATASKRLLRSIRKHRNQKEKTMQPEHQPLSPAVESVSDAVTDHSDEQIINKQEPIASSHDIRRDAADIPPFIREKLATFYGKRSDTSESRTEIRNKDQKSSNFSGHFAGIIVKIRKITLKTLARGYVLATSSVKSFIRNTATANRNIINSYQHLIPLHKKIILSGSAACILATCIVTFFLLKNDHPKTAPAVTETPKTDDLSSVFPIATEKSARLVDEPSILMRKDDLVDTVSLDGKTFLISSKSIFSIQENKDYPLFGANGRVMFATPMDDLRLIFLYTDGGDLLAWSPISRTFTKNMLNLPEGTIVKSIGTYLTYLYVLDSGNNQIYRFPRADGGFGTPSVWLRDSVVFGDGAKIAINETLFIAPDKTSLKAFFRGRLAKDFESPTTPISITDIYAHPEMRNIYGLDNNSKRIIAWNQDGVIIAQYFSEQLSNANAITVDESLGEAIITTDDALLSFKIGG